MNDLDIDFDNPPPAPRLHAIQWNNEEMIEHIMEMNFEDRSLEYLITHLFHQSLFENIRKKHQLKKTCIHLQKLQSFNGFKLRG